jgi:hypothetical protein
MIHVAYGGNCRVNQMVGDGASSKGRAKEGCDKHIISFSRTKDDM